MGAARDERLEEENKKKGYSRKIPGIDFLKQLERTCIHKWPGVAKVCTRFDLSDFHGSFTLSWKLVGRKEGKMEEEGEEEEEESCWCIYKYIFFFRPNSYTCG